VSQSVGVNFKSKIPTLGDDASIEEALRVYHYGVDSYSGQSIPVDSIEGNFVAIDSRVSLLESGLSAALSSLIRRVSLSLSPNIITAESVSVVPLTIRAINFQTSSLQEWQNSSSSVVARISSGGSFAMSGYLSVGTSSISSSVAISANILNASNVGLVVRGFSSQTANLQEWQNSSGQILSRVGSNGSISVGENVSITSAGVVDIISINSRAGSYTIQGSDRSRLVEINSADPNNLTVPSDSTFNFPIGTKIDILQSGIGQTTISAASGVTINSVSGLKLSDQWAAATLVKRGANSWVLIGSLSE
jgi:hypothetical protein